LIFVGPQLGSVISEDDHESSRPESDLLECISVSQDDGVTAFTPYDGLIVFRFRFMELQRNIGCMEGIGSLRKNEDEEVSLTLWDRCTSLRFLMHVVWPVSTFSSCRFNLLEKKGALKNVRAYRS